MRPIPLRRPYQQAPEDRRQAGPTAGARRNAKRSPLPRPGSRASAGTDRDLAPRGMCSRAVRRRLAGSGFASSNDHERGTSNGKAFSAKHVNPEEVRQGSPREALRDDSIQGHRSRGRRVRSPARTSLRHAGEGCRGERKNGRGNAQAGRRDPQARPRNTHDGQGDLHDRSSYDLHRDRFGDHTFILKEAETSIHQPGRGASLSLPIFELIKGMDLARKEFLLVHDRSSKVLLSSWTAMIYSITKIIAKFTRSAPRHFLNSQVQVRQTCKRRLLIRHRA